jgi:thiamine-monophosphate kinase
MIRRGEFDLIGDLFAPLAARNAGALGLKDDAALISFAPGRQLVTTVDAMVAGVHFIGDEAPGRIGQKLLRVNLSDLAAMGARPEGYLLTLGLPTSIDDDWLTAFAAGLKSDQDEFQIALLGGDTVSTPGPLTLSLTAFGTVPENAALRRAGVRPGDAIFVSGTIGDAALGLMAVRGELDRIEAPDLARLTERYQLPQPRLELGQALVGLAGAAIDISDGLVADLGHMARAGGVSLKIEIERLPLSPAARFDRGRADRRRRLRAGVQRRGEGGG